MHDIQPRSLAVPPPWGGRSGAQLCFQNRRSRLSPARRRASAPAPCRPTASSGIRDRRDPARRRQPKRRPLTGPPSERRVMTGPPAPRPGRSASLAPLAGAAGIVGPAAAAMAVGIGLGPFVYTPILPLMTARAGLSPQWGAAIATANYAGYLAGAMAGVAAPALLRSRAVYRSSLIVVVATLALMPVLTSDARWAAVRFIAGCASALVFMIAASALLTGLRARGEHLVGHGFGGVGAGIGACGVLVLALR